MHRYESASMFFEIALAGRTVKTVAGKLGKPGQETGKTTVKRYPSAAAAKQAHDKELVAKTQKSYVLVPAKPVASTRTFALGNRTWSVTLDGVRLTHGRSAVEHVTPAEALAAYNKLVRDKLRVGFVEQTSRNPDLERAIDDDPYNASTYSVLGDWLHGQGDPRGELIALQLAGKSIPALDHIAAHAPDLLGPLAAHVKCYDGLYYKPAPDALTWQYGFIHRARMSFNQYWNATFQGDLGDVLELLLRHPSGRFLTELSLMYNDDPADGDLQSLIDLLAKLAPRSLRKLVIGDDVDQISWYHVGKLGKLWPAVPALEVLEIEAGSFDLGTLTLPALRRAIFKTGGLSRASGDAIASATWPRLEHLEVYYGDDDYGGQCKIADALPLLARTDLPGLRRLGLMNSMFADELCAALPRSKLLPQLEYLDLSFGLMSDDGARSIAAHRDAFAHLDVLDVSQNYLSAAGLALLKGTAAKVIAGDQKQVFEDSPDFRYVTVGE